MPFKSEAQRRFLYASDPEMAERWEKETKDKDLPEKLHPEETIPRSQYKRKKPKMTKKADGMFFEKRAKPRAGRFFRDMAGRDDASFHQKTAFMGGMPPGAGGGINVSPGAQGPMRMGTGDGSMYGAGAGKKKKLVKKAAQFNPAQVTQTKASPMGNPANALGTNLKGEQQQPKGDYGTGTGRPKVARENPTSPEYESGMPTGFHRPAHEQPEALEAGGERFHSTEAKAPQYGAGSGIRDGIPSGRMAMNPADNGQTGKHASAMRYYGTSFDLEKQADLGQTWENFKGTLGKVPGQVWKTTKKHTGKRLEQAGQWAEEKAKDPAYAVGGLALGGLGAGLLARGALKGVARGGKRLWRGKQAPPPGMMQRAKQWAFGSGQAA